jgi:hypothetical protein
MKCKIEGCIDKAHSVGLCKNCYAALRYWKIKSAKDIMKRFDKLEIYSNRIKLILPAIPISKKTKNY